VADGFCAAVVAEDSRDGSAAGDGEWEFSAGWDRVAGGSARDDPGAVFEFGWGWRGEGCGGGAGLFDCVGGGWVYAGAVQCDVCGQGCADVFGDREQGGDDAAAGGVGYAAPGDVFAVGDAGPGGWVYAGDAGVGGEFGGGVEGGLDVYAGVGWGADLRCGAGGGGGEAEKAAAGT